MSGATTAERPDTRLRVHAVVMRQGGIDEAIARHNARSKRRILLEANRWLEVVRWLRALVGSVRCVLRWHERRWWGVYRGAVAMEWIVAKSSSATKKPYVARDAAVDRGIVRITGVSPSAE